MNDRPHIHLEVKEGEDGEIERVRVRFGPHFAVEVRDGDESVTFELVHIHHGFRADATELGGELERIIDEIRGSHPDAAID